ncbi:SH3 domain-containing protein [Micrococcus terreus]|uniref:SH3 domain-containing protein n=1 Tax=Micrococcus terreus TaxID=574650 RepID=UPI003D71D423
MTIRSTLRRRIAAASATALLTVTGAGLLGIPAAHAAATGYTTASVTVRSGTNTSTTALTTIPAGVAISVQCQTAGQTINGTYSTHYWGKVTYGGKTGYVSREYSAF